MRKTAASTSNHLKKLLEKVVRTMSLSDRPTSSAKKSDQRSNLRKKRSWTKQIHLEPLEKRMLLSAGYDYAIVVQTGDKLGLVEVGARPSINSQGRVAFVGKTRDGESVFVGDGSDQPVNLTGDPDPMGLGHSVWINDRDMVAVHKQQSRTRVGTFRIELYDANSPGSHQVVTTGGVGDAASIDCLPTPIGPLCYPKPGFDPDPYDAVFSNLTFNNRNEIAFSALQKESGTLILASHPAGEEKALHPHSSTKPAMADDGNLVLRDDSSSSIISYTIGSGATETIASPSRFVALGTAPGISDDGQVVAFFGEDADGPGVFVSIQTTSGRTIERVAGPDDGFTNFAAESRVGVSTIQPDQPFVSVVYIAERNGKEGIYTNQIRFLMAQDEPFDRLDPAGFVISEATTIVETGDVVFEDANDDGVFQENELRLPGEVHSINIHDPINSRGQGDVAFWVQTTTGTEGVIRAEPRSKQKVVLAWGHHAPFLVGEVRNPLYPTLGEEHYNLYFDSGTMAPATVRDSYKELILGHVQKQFYDSGITGVTIVNGDPEPGATVVYLAEPFLKSGLLGRAWDGVDRFNQRVDDRVLVFTQFYNGIIREELLSPQMDAETISHEIGHALGLRHVRPGSAVMDYDHGKFGAIETFANCTTPGRSACNVTEPPKGDGIVTKITHNPQYHLRRYVDLVSHEQLVSSGIRPGTWDLDIYFDPLLSEFGLFTEENVTLYDAYLLANANRSEMGQGGYGVEVIEHFSEIQLSDLASRRFTVSGELEVGLLASSTPGGPHDIVLAGGSSESPSSLFFQPGKADQAGYLRKAVAGAPGGLVNLSAVILSGHTINSEPVARDDSVSVNQGFSIDIDVLSNDSDKYGGLDPASVTLATEPAHGAANFDISTGLVTYEPISDFKGVDSFGYTVRDISGLESNVATVSVTVRDVNASPVTVEDSATSTQNTPVNINVLVNDYDPDGVINPTSVSIVTDPELGTVEIHPATGLLTYTPLPNVDAIDVLHYTVKDDDGLVSQPTAVTITIDGVNEIPVANNDTVHVDLNTAVVIDLLSNDLDVDGTLDPTSIKIATYPSNGRVEVHDHGRVTYTPNSDYAGNDFFEYHVQDDHGDVSDVAKVELSVALPLIIVQDYRLIDNGGMIYMGAISQEMKPLEQTITLRNRGLKTVNLDQVTVEGEGYSVANLQTTEILPGESLELVASLAPTRIGRELSGLLKVFTEEDASHSYYLRLVGDVIELPHTVYSTSGSSGSSIIEFERDRNYNIRPRTIDSITIPDSYPIDDVSVMLDMNIEFTHGCASGYVELVSPGRTRVRLTDWHHAALHVKQPSKANFSHTYFDQDAESPIGRWSPEEPFTHRYKTWDHGDGGLANLNGDDIKGTWSLQLTNNGCHAYLYPVTVTLNDWWLISSEQNTAPILAPIQDQRVVVDELLRVHAKATDLNSDHLTFSLDKQAPKGVEIDATSGEITWRPTNQSSSESYDITVNVTDQRDNTLIDQETFTVTVLGRPTVERLQPGSVKPSDRLQEISIYFSEPMNRESVENPDNYFVAMGGRTGLEISTAQYVESDGEHRVTLTLDSDDRLEPGVYEVRVDGGQLQSIDGVTMTDAIDELTVHVHQHNYIGTMGLGVEGELTMIGKPFYFADPSKLDCFNQISRDFDGDQNSDLICLQKEDRKLIRYTGLPEGGFEETQSIGIGMDPTRMTGLDWDQDGLSDVVISASEGFVILVSDSQGNLTHAPETPIRVPARSPFFGDFTGQGHTEIIQVNGNGLEIIGKDRFLGYEIIQTIELEDPVGIKRAVDLNEDGKLDLLLSGFTFRLYGSTHSNAVLLSNENGFGEPQPLTFSGVGGAGFYVADFNHDGHLDLLATEDRFSNLRGIHDMDVIHFLEGDGTGHFVLAQREPDFSVREFR